MRSHGIVIAALVAAVGGAAQTPSPSPTIAATTQHFELHSDPWINLHHFLYQWARQDAGLGGDQPVVVSERESLAKVPAATRDGWMRAVAFYREAVASKGLFDLEMMRLKSGLVNLSANTSARPPDPIKGIATALGAAMPIYLTTWWPEHDKANRAWIDEVVGRLRRHERGFVALSMRLNGAVWPNERWRVDASAYANGRAGYTTREGHVVVFSTDPRVQDLAGLEIIFHEIQHADAIEGSTPAAFDKAFADAGVPEPDNLWHALIFATAGEFVRSIAAGEGRPRYQPYWIEQGFETRAGWRTLVPAVNQHWLPVVRGESPREQGLAALARAFRSPAR